MSLLTEVLEYEHRGRISLDWRRTGLTCTIRLPLDEVVAVPPRAETADRAAENLRAQPLPERGQASPALRASSSVR